MELFERLKRWWRPRQIHHTTEARFIPHANIMRAIPYWPEGLVPEFRAVVLIEAMHQIMQGGALRPFDRVAGTRRSLGRVTDMYYQLYRAFPPAPPGTNDKLTEIIRLTARELEQMCHNKNHPYHDPTLYPHPDIGWKLKPGLGYTFSNGAFQPKNVKGHSIAWPVFYIDGRRTVLGMIIEDLHAAMRKIGADDIMIAKLEMEPTMADVLPESGDYDAWLKKQARRLVTFYGGK